VLTGAITRAIAAEIAGQDPGVEQSYRFGFARLGPILVVSILVGLATLLGLIVFIIPGIYIGVRLAVSIQAVVVEGRRGTEAMRRSWDLVGGHWWHTALTVLLAGLLTEVVNAVITAPFNAGAWLAQAVGAAVATTVTMPYSALVGVLLYLDLRARKERLDLDTLTTDLQASAT
jgi:Membrane domain of glycerophosphoryl diester phosphodiesterase